jgi:hypothetical protein
MTEPRVSSQNQSPEAESGRATPAWGTGIGDGANGPDWLPPTVTDRPTDEPALTLDVVSAMLHRASIAKSRIQELEMTAQRDHERVDEMLKDATAVDRKTIAEAIATASEFWRKRVAAMEPGERQSVNLAWGRLEARKVGKKIEKAEPAELLAWVMETGEGAGYHRQVVVVRDEPDWKLIKADIAAGKLKDVPGVEITDDGDYTVKVTID